MTPAPKLTEEYRSPHGVVRWTRLGAGPPVVLLHGTPFSSYVWRDVAEGLVATGHTVYLWDMPGYGQSEMRAGQDVSLPAQQEVFTGLLRHWGLDSRQDPTAVRPAVAAHDFGGAVALRTTLLDGVPYDRLVLLDAVALRPWGSPTFRLLGGHGEVFGQLPEAQHEALVRTYVSTVSPRPLAPEVLDAVVAPWLGEIGQAAFYRQLAQGDQRFTAEIEDRYADLDLPVLVGWGAQDQWLPTEHAHRLAATIPGARTELFEGAGHLVQEDAPGRLTGVLADFLSS